MDIKLAYLVYRSNHKKGANNKNKLDLQNNIFQEKTEKVYLTY